MKEKSFLANKLAFEKTKEDIVESRMLTIYKAGVGFGLAVLAFIGALISDFGLRTGLPGLKPIAVSFVIVVKNIFVLSMSLAVIYSSNMMLMSFLYKLVLIDLEEFNTEKEV